MLDEANVLTWFLDPAIEFPNPTEATNLEPLLINTAGSWEDRPDATTRIPNLLLAADYVRTNTDLATMEGANEAARQAVNAILDRTGSRAPRCERVHAPRAARAQARTDARRAALAPVPPPGAVAAHGRARTAASSRATCSRAACCAAGGLSRRLGR